MTDVLFLLAVAFLLASWYVTARRRARAVIVELLADLGEASARGLVDVSEGRLHPGTVTFWLWDLESEGIVQSFPTFRYALVPHA